uniref:DUF7788 domain-containing protein n=1 Tax=Zea mays TaxID=4577 RepID=A0A804U6K6_MAIZE
MVDDMRALSKLSNCVAVCDMSGSMYGRPMEVCVALGLLVSELSDDPWRGRVVTFSRRPELHRITGETLSEKTRFIQSMAWGTNTDFQVMFNKILEVAIGARLAPERMTSGAGGTATNKSNKNKRKAPLKRSKGSLGSLDVVAVKNNKSPTKPSTSSSNEGSSQSESGSGSSSEGSSTNSESGSRVKDNSEQGQGNGHYEILGYHEDKLFNYIFYVYFEASMADVRTQNALKGLEEVASFLRVLGCYSCNTITI